MSCIVEQDIGVQCRREVSVNPLGTGWRNTMEYGVWGVEDRATWRLDSPCLTSSSVPCILVS